MTCVVFCGPSLDLDNARTIAPNAVFLGPARCGDVYRAVRRGATCIGLIDGYFDHTLSVWHKEILWALSRGVVVYGAASMGALRAAELAAFGMRGVGAIFEQYRSGQLEDDDEVAMVHEPAEQGYKARSDAMVNLRATLDAACRAGALSEAARTPIVEELKQLFYPLRCLRELQAIAIRQLGAQGSNDFLAWLSQYGVLDLKRSDAQLMLRCVAVPELGPPPQPEAASSWRLEETDAWQTLKTSIEREFLEADTPKRTARDEPPASLELLAWLKNAPAELGRQVLALANERALALLVAKQAGASVNPEVVQKASEVFREQRGLLTPEQTQAWLEANAADVSCFSGLIHDNVLSERAAEAAHSLALAQIPSVLRMLEMYPRK